MHATIRLTEGARLHAKRLALGLAMVMTFLSTASAEAHIIPWRDGMSRMVGFGHCAKGPCMKRYDFSSSVPHVHVRADGKPSVVICTGLTHQHPDPCPSRARDGG